MQGRKKGSVSFAVVSLEELNKRFKLNAPIIVSVRWANLLHLQNRPINGETKKIKEYASADEQIEIVSVTND